MFYILLIYFTNITLHITSKSLCKNILLHIFDKEKVAWKFLSMENSSTSLVPNNKIRVLFGFEPPDTSVDCRDFPHLSDPSFGCPFPGSTLEIVSMLAAFLKWEIIPSVDIPTEYGRLDYGGLQPDGSYSGMMGYITRNEVDTICTLTQYEINNKDSPFELSYPVYNVNLIYLARNVPPRWQDYLLKALVPYSTVVWVAILASLIAQIIFGVFVRKVEINMKLEIDFSPFKTLWHYVGYQTNQPIDDIFVYYKTSAGNWAYFLFGLFQVSLFLNLYQTLLLSALLQVPNMDPFHSSEEMFDLIASGRYTYVIDAINFYSDWYISTWNNTDLEHIRQLNEALKSNPALITNTTEEAFAYLQQGGYIYPSQDDTYEMYITQPLCDLYIFSADTPQKSSMFIFLKNATLLKEWNRAIIMNQDFIQRTFYKYYRSGFITGNAYPNCTADPKENLPDSIKPLDLWSISGIILLLLLGCALAFIAFIVENIIVFVKIKLIRSKSVKLKLNTMASIPNEKFRRRTSTQITTVSFSGD